MARVRGGRHQTGKLAVTRRDGRPHVTPIWFLLDGDDIVLTTHRDGVKGKALRWDPRAAHGARNGVPGELLVRLRAEKIIAMRDVAD